MIWICVVNFHISTHLKGVEDWHLFEGGAKSQHYSHKIFLSINNSIKDPNLNFKSLFSLYLEITWVFQGATSVTLLNFSRPAQQDLKPERGFLNKVVSLPPWIEGGNQILEFSETMSLENCERQRDFLRGVGIRFFWISMARNPWQPCRKNYWMMIFIHK